LFSSLVERSGEGPKAFLSSLLVQARDENSGRTSLKPALKLFHRHGQEIYNVKISALDGRFETINATAEHPFHVRGEGWVGASKFIPGDIVEQFDGQGERVESVERDPALQDTETLGGPL
jgi:hypothetical protein